jgi:hypothetical protein
MGIIGSDRKSFKGSFTLAVGVLPQASKNKMGKQMNLLICF